MVVTAAVLLRQGKVLIAKRREEGKWEFPGGKVEENESLEDCIKRELKEELGITIENPKKFMTVENGDITLHVFIGYYNKEVKAKEHVEVKWVSIEELIDYDFMDADREVVRNLLKKVKDIH